MSWNHRVVYHGPKSVKVGEKEVLQEEWYGIHEVYYDEDGKPEMYVIDPVINGDNIDELEGIIEWLGNCLAKPTLNVKFFEELSEEREKDG